MQQVGHHRFRQLAVVVEEGCVDVQEVHAFSIGEASDALVDPVVDLSELVIVGGSARENSQQQDPGPGEFFLENLEDLLDARCGLFGRILAVTGVVGADHDHGELRGDAVDLAVLQSPDHVFGTVTAVTDVEGISLGVEF